MENILDINQLIDTDFKDESPTATVENIKRILKKHKLETEELWSDSKVPYCYSLSVIIKGTSFSVNGKGLTREFALASGYGELMERLQLGYVGKRAVQKDGIYSSNDALAKKIPAKTLLENNRNCYERIASRLKEWNGTVITPEEVIMQYADSNGNVFSTPFINLTNGRTEYFPLDLRKNIYTSNGCAAGNTTEEALVQALSEIVERYYRLKITSQKISTPIIPDEKLKRYKIAYQIIEYIRKKGYKVLVKDCSLGMKFPMVCVCYIDTKSGRYHTHFGAYPIFEIALERALTETFQGREIDSFAMYDGLLLTNSEKSFVSNMTHELIHGTSMRMPEFFIGSPSYEYNENSTFKGKNNKELLKECIEFFREQGYSVLARNASSLGFPTYQIIIPGYSETCIHRVSKNTNESRYLPFAVRTFRDPASSDISDMTGMLLHMNEMKTFFTGDLKRNSFISNAKIMADLNNKEQTFFMSATMAYVYYTLGNLPLAEKHVDQMLKNNTNYNEEFLVCLKRYLSMKVCNCDSITIENTLSFLHNEETKSKLYSYIDSGLNPLNDYVLHCDLTNCNNCPIKDKCFQKNAQKLIDIVNEAEKQSSFDEFSKKINNIIL